MSDDRTDAAGPPEGQAAGEGEGGAPAGKRWVKMLLLIAGLSVGGALGVVLLGPALGARLAAGESGDGGDGGGHGGGHGAAVERLHTIEHLVVNPAGSEGRRFLLVSVSLEPTDGDTGRLESLEPELRAAIIPVLADRDVPQLLDLAQRPDLIAAVTAAIEAVAGEGSIARVIFPQFVVQ